MAVALRANHHAHAGDEAELVAAVRQGNDRAFEVLYGRYRPRIGAYAQSMIGDHGRAEDVAQEVFISALRRLRATDQPIIFKPWLYEIAKNACIDEHRRTRRAQEVPLEGEGEAQEIGTLHSLTLSPHAAVETKQRLDDLRGAFRGLSDSHHKILVLRELEGLSYNQIGAQLGISKPVVESTLFRARRRLGEEFAELESGRRCARVVSLIAGASGNRATALGLRERRMLARHIAHCDSCRRHAWAAGMGDIDEPVSRKPGKASATVLLPIPWLRLRKSEGSVRAVVAPGAHAATTLQNLLGPAMSPLSSGAGRLTMAAMLAIAGAGGGIVASNSVGRGSWSARRVPEHVRVSHGGFTRGATARHGAPSIAQTVATTAATVVAGVTADPASGGANATGVKATGATLAVAGALPLLPRWGGPVTLTLQARPSPVNAGAGVIQRLGGDDDGGLNLRPVAGDGGVGGIAGTGLPGIPSITGGPLTPAAATAIVQARITLPASDSAAGHGLGTTPPAATPPITLTFGGPLPTLPLGGVATAGTATTSGGDVIGSGGSAGAGSGTSAGAAPGAGGSTGTSAPPSGTPATGAPVSGQDPVSSTVATATHAVSHLAPILHSATQPVASTVHHVIHGIGSASGTPSAPSGPSGSRGAPASGGTSEGAGGTSGTSGAPGGSGAGRGSGASGGSGAGGGSTAGAGGGSGAQSGATSRLTHTVTGAASTATGAAGSAVSGVPSTASGATSALTGTASGASTGLTGAAKSATAALTSGAASVLGSSSHS